MCSTTCTYTPVVCPFPASYTLQTVRSTLFPSGMGSGKARSVSRMGSSGADIWWQWCGRSSPSIMLLATEILKSSCAMREEVAAL